METLEKIEVTTPTSLISLAIDKGQSVADLKGLFELQERWEASRARKAFFQAFTRFQASAPDIRKTKEVAFGDTRYKFAPLGDITRQLSEALEKAELSYRWEIQDEDKIKVTCLVSHIDGHTERTTMQADPDTSGKKNPIQARGSAIEYMKRYTLIGALGLATTDSDVDGQMPAEYEYNVDDLHKKFMVIYDEVIRLDPKRTSAHPDNWLIERTGRNYVKAIGDLRKILFDLQQKSKH